MNIYPFFIFKLDQLGLHPQKQFHLINLLMFSLCPPSSQKAINPPRVRNTQIITEQFQVRGKQNKMWGLKKQWKQTKHLFPSVLDTN